MSQQIQDLITENETTAAETEAMGFDALRRAELIAEVSRAVTSEARHQVMAVSGDAGGLTSRFNLHGANEVALQRLLAETIGGIDSHMERMAKNAREFGVASMARAQTLREQAEKLRGVVADTQPLTRPEPDPSDS